MANQSELTNWLLAKQSELDLRVTECTWIGDVFPGWHDLDLSVSIAGRRFNGRGSSTDGDTALCKAFCEAVERFVCSSYDIRSHGVAGHYLPEEAKNNARLEYIERRSLAHQVDSHAKLSSLPVPELIASRYGELGIAVDLFAINTVPGVSAAVSIANGLKCKNQFGGILGLGAHNESKYAATKAMIECLRNLEAYIEHPMVPLPVADFSQIASPTGPQRQALLSDVSYFSHLMATFNQDQYTAPDIAVGVFEELEIRDPAFKNCPLRFFRFQDGDHHSLELEFVG
jgi:hypothetical protein